MILMMKILTFGKFSTCGFNDCQRNFIRFLMGVNANNRVPSDIETASEAFSVAKTMLEEIIKKPPGCQVRFAASISHIVSTKYFTTGRDRIAPKSKVGNG